QCRIQPYLDQHGPGSERRQRDGCHTQEPSRGAAASSHEAQRTRGNTQEMRPRRMSIGRKGNNDRVTAASAIEKSRIHSLTRPNMVSVGTIVCLSSELMFFAALF